MSKLKGHRKQKVKNHCCNTEKHNIVSAAFNSCY